MKVKSVLLVVLLVKITTFSQTTESPAPSAPVPPGAIATFMRPAPEQKDNNLPIVYLKADVEGPERSKVWIAESRIINGYTPPGASQSSPATNTLGFVVPQLDPGVYIAWYEDKPGELADAVRIRITPKLIVRQAVVYDNAQEEVRIEVGIKLPFIMEKTGSGIEKRDVSVEVRLTPKDPTIASLSKVQPQAVVTDKDGFASWRVKINRGGTTSFIAEAANFESAEVIVVGQSPEAGKIETAEQVLQTAQENTSKKEDSAMISKADYTALKMRKAIGNTIPESTLSAKKDEVESAEKRVQEAELLESQARVKLEALRGSASPLDRLLPGDVLLYQGKTFFISDAIRVFESTQLLQLASFSHAGLYLGMINGQRAVAEMLDGGYTVNTLENSMSAATRVDVYRWPEISDEKRAEIAERGKTICGQPEFSSSKTCIPYAWEQIGVLTAALRTSAFALNIIANVADISSGGRKKMICSEFVAWIYLDSGLDPLPQKWWPSIQNSGLLTSMNRKKDYTTPNMLTLSKNFITAFRLK